MSKLRSWIPVAVLSAVLLGLVITTTSLTPANTIGYAFGVLLSPFIIISLISRKTHWTGIQQVVRMLVLAIIFQVLLSLPLESPKSLINLISSVALIWFIIVIIIEAFHKKGGK